MYTREQIERARTADVVEVAGRLNLPLKRYGATWMTCCVAHEERTPSMQVGGKHNIAKCYACGAALDPIGLVQKVNGCDFREAVGYIIGEDPLPSLSLNGKGARHGGHSGRGGKLYLRQRPVVQNVTDSPFRGVGGPDGGLDGGLIIYHVDLATGEMKLDGDCRGRVEDFYPNMDNSLSVCLLHLFPREVVEAVTSRYGLGVWTDRSFVRGTLFPSIDLKGRCHNIKVQEYETRPESERFMHRKGSTVWLGTVLQRAGRHVNTGTFDTQALFGEHLLTLPGTVALVESPKNAVVGACQWPELLWVAVGNKSALTDGRLQPLKGRNVLVFPDKDALTEWQERLERLKPLANFRLCTQWMDEVGEKGDIADWILGKIYGAIKRGQ